MALIPFPSLRRHAPLISPPMLIDSDFTWLDWAWRLPGIFLYVEMHYRWWPLPSRYFRREPEILADLPHRLEPGQDLPLLLLVKDAHRYPIVLQRVTLMVETDEGQMPLDEIAVNEELTEPWWHRVITLERPIPHGNIKLWTTFHYTVKGKARTCTTHNLKSLPPRPLTIHLARDPLPGENVIWGDLHHHTNLTEDMIEFGAPLEATQAAATALGLGFVCAADHSYDLDDLPGDWVRSDPDLVKWHSSRAEIKVLNEHRDRALVVPSEEVSTRNTLGRTVHTLVLNHPDYLPGSGDGGERLIRQPSELDIAELTDQLGPGALALAAHPFQPVPFLQWAIIGRGVWQDRDTRQPGITGLQILNGGLDAGFFQGLEEWKRLLLAGQRTFIYAGTDAHGDFNLHRQIKVPFVSLTERPTKVLGSCRTGVLDIEPGDLPGLLAGLKAGRCIITTGPFLTMTLATPQATARIGETIDGSVVTVSLRMASSA
ncbi:MAG: hypothetical protein IIB42_06045, partial [Candidatus Marinimicrobia bacterium]|nr:hypothetical protein [Candidatus Neomarinimicrobiota bacterium]